MKMKKLIGGLLLAINIIMFSSCEEILNQMSNVPTFYIPEVIYNGQSYQITRFAICKYNFWTDSKYLNIKENEDGKFIATASGDWTTETSLKYVLVNVSANNPDDNSIETQVEQTKLHDWEIRVFEGETAVDLKKLEVGSVYTIKMYDTLTDTFVSELWGSYNDKDNVQRLDWLYGVDKIDVSDKNVTSLTFKAIKSGDFSVTATLGNYKQTIQLHVL